MRCLSTMLAHQKCSSRVPSWHVRHCWTREVSRIHHDQISRTRLPSDIKLNHMKDSIDTQERSSRKLSLAVCSKRRLILLLSRSLGWGMSLFVGAIIRGWLPILIWGEISKKLIFHFYYGGKMYENKKQRKFDQSPKLENTCPNNASASRARDYPTYFPNSICFKRRLNK